MSGQPIPRCALALLILCCLTVLGGCGGRVMSPIEPSGSSVVDALEAGMNITPAVHPDSAAPTGLHGIPAVQPAPADALALLQRELSRAVSATDIPFHPPAGAVPGFGISVYVNQDVVEDGQTRHLEISWADALPGDLDLNGEVNGSDLLPLARYFGYNLTAFTSAVPDGAAWFSRLDGDDNGLIGLGDLTEISRHYHERIDGYRIYHRSGDGSWTMLPDPSRAANPYSIARSNVQPTGAIHAPLEFVYTWTQVPVGELQVKVVPCMGPPVQEGGPSRVVSVVMLRQGEQWLGPQVSMQSSLQPVYLIGNPVAMQFHFDAVPASDFPLDFDFDVDSDGVYDFHQTVPAATEWDYELPLPVGQYALVIRVGNSSGVTGFFWTQFFKVRQSNKPPIVDAELELPDLHAPARLKIINHSFDPDDDQLDATSYTLQTPGQPDMVGTLNNETHLTLWKAGIYSLRISSSDNLGATSSTLYNFTLDAVQQVHPGWDVTTLPYSEDSVSSAATIGGNPAIVMFDRYYRANDPAGTSWPAETAAVTIPEATAVNNSLYDVRGRPFSLQFGRGGGGFFGFSLDYTCATDDTGMTWQPSQPLNAALLLYNVPGQLSRCGGRPTVLTHTGSGIGLLRADDAYGTSWTATPVDTPVLSPVRSWFTRNGKAVVFSVTSEPDGIDPVGHVFKALDVEGTQWDAPIDFPLAPFNADVQLLDIPGSRPVLLGTERNLQSNLYELQTAYALDDSWETWSGPQAVPGSAVQLPFDTVAICSGRLCVVCHDLASLSLSFVQAANGGATEWLPPVTIDDRGACGGTAHLVDAGGQPGVFYRVVTSPDQQADDTVEWRFARRRP
jgi:hypothetical protein